MDRITFQEWPAALRRRWLLTGAAGIGILLVGLAVFLSIGDRLLLMLSGMLALCTLLRCAAYYRTIRCDRYEAVEGTCVAFGRAGLGRQRKVRLLLQDGRETVVTMDKQMDMRIGHQYRIFYRLESASPPGGGDSQDPLVVNLFLALEDLGECQPDTAIDDKEDTNHEV